MKLLCVLLIFMSGHKHEFKTFNQSFLVTVRNFLQFAFTCQNIRKHDGLLNE